ncbi:MAG: type transport system ATP-binding protein [Mycobacterium sp.]|nr:type transport system ATP-binding protein [Mycobacterium sp.]
MTAAVEATALGKRYRQHWALSDCTLQIPANRVVGLVGPNGAGKSTLLNLAAGLTAPTTGEIEVLGTRPASSPEALARIGFVPQDSSLYSRLSINDHLHLGARLNPGWDSTLARQRVEQLGLDPQVKIHRLSGGQRAQVAFTMAMAKRPQLLIMDEPVASLNPLARRESMRLLMATVAEHGVSVVVSSHQLDDLERICDYLIVLVGSRVHLAGEVDDISAAHHLLTGPRRDPIRLPADQELITASNTDRQTTILVRSEGKILDPTWTISPPSLEDIVLAYLSRGLARPIAPVMAVQR